MFFHLHPNRRVAVCEHDDDDSMRSTVSVDRTSKTVPIHLEEEDCSTRQVRFDLSSNEEHQNEYSKEDCRSLWYTAADYTCFRHMTYHSVRFLALAAAEDKTQHSYQRVMERTYNICKDVISEDTESWRSLSTPQQRLKLNYWTEVAAGLEKWASRENAQDKQQRRLAMMDAVADIQSSRSSSWCCTADDKAEFIAKTCQRLSRPSRMFAQALATVSEPSGFFHCA